MLKGNKVVGEGNSYEFMLVSIKLFEKLLHSENFPEEWPVGITLVLFKCGDEAVLHNYTGTTLLIIL